MGNNRKKVNLDTSDETKSFQERIDDIRTLVEENLRYTKSLRNNGSSKEVEVQEKLQKLLEENLKISKDLYNMTKKIKRWVVWQRVWGMVKILIIVIPIVLGAIYLPPLLKEAVKPYQELLNFNKDSGQSIDPGLIEQFKDQMNKNE